MEVNAAVAALKEQLTALQTNTDPSRNNMLKLNLREAQEALGRWEARLVIRLFVGMGAWAGLPAAHVGLLSMQVAACATVCRWLPAPPLPVLLQSKASSLLGGSAAQGAALPPQQPLVLPLCQLLS